MRAKRGLIGAHVLLLGILACNLQAGPSSQPDLSGTITAQAQTLQAPAGTAIPAGASPSGPWVSVTSSIECRAGPGTQYGIVFTLNPGGTVRVVGKNTSTDHWIIYNPAGEPCWLPAREVVFTGDASALPDYPVPAAAAGTPKPTQPPKATKTPQSSPALALTFTPTIGVPYTPGVPGFPINVTAYKICKSTMVGADRYWIEDVTLTWQDRADNETGYRIYIATKKFPTPQLGDTLGPNETHYDFEEQYLDFNLQADPWEQFYVAAFNDVGESIRMGALLDHCH